MFGRQLIRPLSLAIILSAGILIGCGPSAEEQAATSDALTAAAATNTPTVTPTLTPTPTSTPTPTPTPIPYDLSVLVAGEEDALIIGATVVLAEVEGDDGTQNTDDVGQAFWYDLPGETVNLSISAQGYFPLEQTDSIERGVNQMTVALERDPHGMLPSEACAPGERLLYIEDFQDGKAQDWEEIEYRTQGWDIAPHPDSPGNMVAQNATGDGAGATLHDHNFNNAVWRFEYMYSGRGATYFGAGWSYVDEPYDIEKGEVESSSYNIWIDPTKPYLNTGRCQYPFGCIELSLSRARPAPGEWHSVEVGTYQNQLEMWIDGRRYLNYSDPIPLPNGTLALEASVPPDGQTVVYFDDLSVCELTAPLGTAPTPES
jgi:hypothetical protein